MPRLWGARAAGQHQFSSDQHAGAAGIIVGIGLMAGAFLLAMTLLSYVGMFVTVLLFVLLGILGMQKLWRGSMLMRARVAELKVLRAEKGTGQMALALAGSLRERHPVHTVLGIFAMVFCAGILFVYATSGLLLRLVRRT